MTMPVRPTIAAEEATQRLPEHALLAVDWVSGDGWEAVIDEIVHYSNVPRSIARAYLAREVVEPFTLTRAAEAEYTVLGVRVKVSRPRR